MTVDVEAHLRAYTRHVGSLISPVGLEEIRDKRIDAPGREGSLAASVDSALDSTEAEIGERSVEDQRVGYLHQRPDDNDAPRRQRGRFGFVAAVAASIVVVVGVVLAGGNDGELETESGAAPERSESAPGVAEPPADTAFPAPPLFADGRMEAVTATENGFVAVGSSEEHAPVWTSPDGVTWSRAPHDEVTFAGRIEPPNLTDVTALGPTLVAVGASGDGNGSAVWTSVDGISWSRLAHDDDVSGRLGMNRLTLGGPGLVAVGLVGPYSARDAAVWTSVDGSSWSRVPHDGEVFGGLSDEEMLDVAAGGPGLVAVGVDRPNHTVWNVAAVWTSVDGLTWSRVAHDEAVFGARDTESGWWAGSGMTSVAAGGPGLVAVGSVSSPVDEYTDESESFDAAVWTSPDGHTWSRVPHDEAVFGGSRAHMADVTAGGPGFVAVGEDEDGAAVWTSVDGLTWSRVPHDPSIFGGGAMSGVVATEAAVVAVGQDEHGAAVWRSVDGLTWSRVRGDDEPG